MVAKEWKFIGKNRLILISVLAIMIIPFLYSIFFLKSVWNPYGETQHLPVAVVNNDKAVTYQGQKLDVGDQAVKSLKKDHQLGWWFVSEKKAKQGLKDKKYYTIVTFPKDTSKNAASVLSKNPKKMTIQYETNGSLNYIGEVISQIGATGLNEKIRQTVIKAYADATFSQVKKVGKGMTQAANGAKTLSKGQKTLGTGIDTYTAAVSQVNDGVQTMKMSVGPLASGVNQLADGGNALNNGLQTLNGSTGSLASGVNQLANGGNTLNSGLQTLNGSTGSLASGVGQLANGSKAVNAGAQQYTAAVSQLNSGLGQLSANNGKITAGLQNIQSASAQLSQLPAMLTAMQSVHDATPGLQANMASLQSQMGALDKLAALKESLAGINVADLQKGVASANSGLNTVQSAAGTANDSFDKIVADIQNSSLSDADKQTAIAAISGDVKTGKTGALTAQAGAKAVNDGLSAQLTPLMSQMTPALSAINGIDTKQLSSTATTTFAQASALLNTANALTSQDTINQLKALEVQAGGMSTQLAQLQTYVNGVGTAASGASQLNAQSGALTSGTSQLANGTSQLNTQVPTLVSGVQQLANGSYQLAGGLNQLNTQVPTLVSGVQQLANGSYQLAGGLNQLNGQIPTLSNGVAQLADGTSQLNANSPALKNGNKQLVTGSVKLSDSLGDGAKQVNSMPLSSKTSDMFSAPTTLKHKSYSTVKNYGHALAPYVLSVALYVGAIVFNFAYPIRKISMEDQSATAWFFSKASVGLVVAIVQALVETGFMMLFGLEVMHPGMMFAVATAFSVASMFLVMFLSMLLDNPGRFIAMVLLMLQLGGSGGTFPMQVTNGFYNAIHPFLPMTYSILGLREGLTAGLGASTAWNATGLLLMMAVIFAALLWGTMVYLQHIHLQGFSQLDDNQKLQDVEK
ncbi:YhgE/Pip family protein [Furfurilactobacillus entadae]|uniref:YhgE/Pip family protein n=1 Tax=Furfurilactobacillus entadae TaxID=2922307 RepID=UPI0038B374AB